MQVWGCHTHMMHVDMHIAYAAGFSNCPRYPNCFSTCLTKPIYAYVVIYELITQWVWEQNRKMGVLITPMALAHLHHPLEASERVSDETCGLYWWPSFWAVIYIYHYIHIMHYRYIIINWNKLFLIDIYIQRLDMAMMVYRIMRYYECFLLGCNCIFNFIVQDFLFYNMDKHVDIKWHQLHPIIVYRTTLGVYCSCVGAPFTNSLIECYFIMMVATTIGI